MNPRLIALVMTSVLTCSSLYAADYRTDDPDQSARAIKSLASTEIEALRLGKGLSLAKPAELNGYPGPRHMLDLADALGLAPEQRTAMTRLFETMQADAVAAGERYLKAEAELEQLFRSNKVNSAALQARVDASAQAWAELRLVHLDSHLKAIKRLTRHQVASYNRLRGYGGPAAQHHLH